MRDAFAMTNIPTELLRTLIAVVDMRSFTKAAQSLGVTQPAVSAQIKRLQALLGTDLLDKRAPGVTLTPSGELVVNYARRLLSINDQILDLAGPHPSDQTLRVGAAGDFGVADISSALICFRARHPQSRFVLRCSGMGELQRDLREGAIDVMVWTSSGDPGCESRHRWREELVWVRGATAGIDPERPVPLVSYGEECPFTLSTVAALNAAGRDSELVYVGPSIAGIAAAVAGGLGVTALPRSRALLPGTVIWEDAPLPTLPMIECGICVRPGGDVRLREDLSDTLASALRLHGHVVGALHEEPAPAAKSASAD
jgi:DNA-binding transcriptional LysR family regulator